MPTVIDTDTDLASLPLVDACINRYLIRGSVGLSTNVYFSLVAYILKNNEKFDVIDYSTNIYMLDDSLWLVIPRAANGTYDNNKIDIWHIQIYPPISNT